MPFAPTRTPKNEPGFIPKTVLEPETWAVFACVSVWGGWSAPLRRSEPHVGGLSVGVRRSKPHVGGLSVGVRRSKPHVGGISVGVRRLKPHVGGLSVGVQRSKPHVGGLSVGVRRSKPRVGGLSVGVRRLEPHVGGISVDVQGGVRPRARIPTEALRFFLIRTTGRARGVHGRRRRTPPAATARSNR